MSDSSGYRRALLAGPQGWVPSAVRPLDPGAAALVAAVPVLYAPEAVLAALGGATSLALWVVLPVAGVTGLVLLALRQVRRTGAGGDSALARAELGPNAGRLAAAALLVDRVLVVALATATAAHLLDAVVPAPPLTTTGLAVLLVVLAALARLGRAPSRRFELGARTALCALVLVVGLVVLVGCIRAVTGTLPTSAAEVPGPGSGVTGLASAAVLARAVAAGSVLVAGTSAPGPVRTTARRAGTARGLGPFLGAVLALAGLLLVARASGVHAPVPGGSGTPLLHQVATVALGPSGATAVLAVLIGCLLTLATVVLGTVPDVRPALAGTRRTTREPPAHHRVTLTLALVAGVVVLLADSAPGALVPAYVLTALTHLALAQLGGARRWRRAMEHHYEPVRRRAARRAQVLAAAGAAVTTAIVALTLGGDRSQGSRLSLVAIGALWAMMWTVGRHRRRIEAELALDHLPEDRPLPSVVHTLVLVTRLDRATMRTLACARAARSGPLAAVTVPLDEPAATELRDQWARAGLDVPLVELAAPLGDRGSALAEHVRELHDADPHCVVAVHLPEVLDGPLARLLAAPERRLRRRLLRLPRTIVTTVPWHATDDRERAEP